MAAHRHTYNELSERRILKHIDSIIEYSRRAIAPGMNVDGSTEAVFYKRAIVLKEPISDHGSVKEKGVLLVKFTDTFVYLHRHFDIEALLRKFYLVLEPSWSGYAQPSILAWLRYRQPILIQASEARDRKLIKRIDGSLRAISIGSSNWVDHRVFRPLDECEKTYDSVLIGDAGLTKRMHVYLHAIARIDDPDYRGALVIGDWGGYRRQILSLIDYYGVADRVAVFNSMSQTDLNVLLNQSKVNVLLSLKEGSNRVLFEGLFAGTPALLLRENVGVNKDYINEDTGLLVDEPRLADALIRMKAVWPRYQTRHWAMEYISFTRSTARIAEKLEAIAAQEGLEFTGPLYEKVNVPEACYPDDPEGEVRERLLDEHIGEFALDPGMSRDDSSATTWTDVRRDRRAGA